MRNLIIAFVGFAALLALTGVVCLSSYVHYANLANSTEQRLKATQEDNQNILAQFGNKVAETVQVPEMYRDDLLKVTSAAIEGRYGNNGSKAIFHAVKEDNPKLDGQLYRQVQQIIESGRNDFQSGQTKLIDEKRQYETFLHNVWGGMWMRLAGYPKINLDSIQIVTTDRAADAFSTHKEAPIQLRPKQ